MTIVSSIVLEAESIRVAIYYASDLERAYEGTLVSIVYFSGISCLEIAEMKNKGLTTLI